MLIAADLDPSGEDITRSFLARSPCWDAVEHLGLTRGQAERWNLPPLPGKTTDRLFQVGLEAVDPNHLRGLYADAIARHSGPEASTAVLDRAAGERQQITETVANLG